MKQGKGTDVLGANDPRSDTIGVIYVSPNDDRKSVLAAILTQEKLGRKQVAVVLPPEQNKAFQRPVDFDDLKTMRRKLQAQVVFIAPSGPGPAEFARQRRFLVYSSLENFAKALRDESQVESASKKGWLFGSSRSKAESGPIASHGNGGRRIPTEPLVPATQEIHTPLHRRSTQYDSEENEPQRSGSALPFVAGAALGGGAALVADSAMSVHGDPVTPARADPLSDPSHTPHDFADDADALGPLSVTSAHTSEPANLSGPTQAIPPSRNADAAIDGGSIIELRPRRSSKATLPLTPREPASVPATPVVAPESDSTTHLPHPKRSSGKIAAAGVGAVAGAAAAGAAVATPARAATSQGRASAAKGLGTVTPRPGGPGGIPPRGTPPGGGGRGNGRGPANPARWIILGLAILTLALLACGGIMAYAQPKSFPGQVAQKIFQQSPATITITPNSQTIQDTYTLVGANTTNTTTREVAVRTITGSKQSPSTPVKATGQNQHVATPATGQITFHNALSFAQQVNAGTSFNLGGGLHIITDAAVSIPPLVGTTVGSQAVSAHADLPGTVGNIGAFTISNVPCCGNGGIVANNFTAFTGGRNAVNYAFLQQSDVTSAISQSIMNVTKQDALNDLSRQLHTGEQFLGSTRCTPTLRADEPIGDQGTNVNSANVIYLMKCTATAYDNLGAQNIVKGLLSEKATTTLGAGYALINNIQADLTSQTNAKNILSLFFTGKGVWAYQFSDAQKLQLAKAIAGKTAAEAQRILKSTPGISNAIVNVNGGGTLPADYNQISIVIQPIAGLGNGGTPTPVGAPTVTGPTVQSGTPGANGKGGSAPPAGGGS